MTSNTKNPPKIPANPAFLLPLVARYSIKQYTNKAMRGNATSASVMSIKHIIATVESNMLRNMAAQTGCLVLNLFLINQVKNVERVAESMTHKTQISKIVSHVQRNMLGGQFPVKKPSSFHRSLQRARAGIYSPVRLKLTTLTAQLGPDCLIHCSFFSQAYVNSFILTIPSLQCFFSSFKNLNDAVGYPWVIQ